jgi:hypothetical protein
MTTTVQDKTVMAHTLAIYDNNSSRQDCDGSYISYI